MVGIGPDIGIWNQTQRPQTTYGVKSWVIHPDYSPSTMNNDVAVLFVSTPVRLNRHVKTVKLATQAGKACALRFFVVAVFGTCFCFPVVFFCFATIFAQASRLLRPLPFNSTLH
jgi:hypothetical protein